MKTSQLETIRRLMEVTQPQTPEDWEKVNNPFRYMDGDGYFIENWYLFLCLTRLIDPNVKIDDKELSSERWIGYVIGCLASKGYDIQLIESKYYHTLKGNIVNVQR